MHIPKYKIEELRQMEHEDALEEIARLRQTDRAKRRVYVEANREKVRKQQANWAARNKKHLRAKSAAHRAQPGVAEQRAAQLREWKKRTGYKAEPVPREQKRIYEANTRSRNKTRKIARERPAELQALIRMQLPAYLSFTAQMDIVHSVTALSLANQVRFQDLSETVRKAVTEYNRQYDHFKNVSIDAPIAGTDGLTRGDMLSNDTPHF